MKRLILKKLTIVSIKEETARTIEFSDKFNVITGDDTDGEAINRTGKSVIMKSIYYALGAKLKKYTTNWNKLQIVTIISFAYEDKSYVLYRNKDSFILKCGNEINRFRKILCRIF